MSTSTIMEMQVKTGLWPGSGMQFSGHLSFALCFGKNNSSVWLESNGPGTEKFEGELYIPRDELSFSEVVVEVSCQKPSVARF